MGPHKVHSPLKYVHGSMSGGSLLHLPKLFVSLGLYFLMCKMACLAGLCSASNPITLSSQDLGPYHNRLQDLSQHGQLQTESVVDNM